MNDDRRPNQPQCERCWIHPARCGNYDRQCIILKLRFLQSDNIELMVVDDQCKAAALLAAERQFTEPKPREFIDYVYRPGFDLMTQLPITEKRWCVMNKLGQNWSEQMGQGDRSKAPARKSPDWMIDSTLINCPTGELELNSQFWQLWMCLELVKNSDK